MKTIFHITLLVFSPLLLTSCFKASVVREETPSLSISKIESKFSSEVGKDTLMVSANRSWSISMDSVVTWCNVEPTENINLSGVTSTFPVVVSFKRNLAKTPRNTEFILRGEGFIQTIKVFQSPADSGSNISTYEPIDQIDTLKW